MESVCSPDQLEPIYQLRDKLSRCGNLKKKLEEEDRMLKGELLHLTLEKDTYTNMLKSILQIGKNVDW